MFVERLRREGREADWYRTVKDVCAELNVRFGQGSGEAMRRLGYEGPEKEKALYLEHQASLKHNELARFVAENTKEWNKELRMNDFEQALAELPATADPAVEMDWVGAHPAMMRAYDLPVGSDKRVKVDANDILAPIHGKSPSKRAAIALRQYVDCPRKFFDQWVSESKKAKGGDQAEEISDTTPEVAEIEALLSELERK
jgi:hypothetical protein